MTDHEAAKAGFADAVGRLVRERYNQPRFGLLDDWIELLLRTGVSALNFSFDPREMDDSYSHGDVVFSQTFFFYDPVYLRECCSPGPDCLAGKHSFPIGGVDGASEFIYVPENLELGIAHLYREDVFSALDLDAVVAENAARLNISLQRFIQLLAPPTNLVKLAATRDASKWLVVEDLGSRVRYEINLSGSSDVGERAFHSPSESDGFFIDLIRRGCAIADLTILECPPHLRQRIESLLGV